MVASGPWSTAPFEALLGSQSVEQQRVVRGGSMLAVLMESALPQVPIGQTLCGRLSAHTRIGNCPGAGRGSAILIHRGAPGGATQNPGRVVTLRAEEELS